MARPGRHLLHGLRNRHAAPAQELEGRRHVVKVVLGVGDALVQRAISGEQHECPARLLHVHHVAKRHDDAVRVKRRRFAVRNGRIGSNELCAKSG